MKKVLIIGCPGSGKTTLAKELQNRIPCNIIHMDDFFLRPEQRTEKRLTLPGENVDHERFLQEVLLPLSKNEEFSFRPYDCKKQTLSTPVTISPKPLTIIEGSYSCHNLLRQYYDLTIFLDTDNEVQLLRIAARNGESALSMFRDKWIPLEEAYFDAFSVRKLCDLYFKN